MESTCSMPGQCPTATAQRVHLVVEALAGREPRACTGGPASATVTCRPIELPPGVSYLVSGGDGRGARVLNAPPEDGGPAFLVEPVPDTRLGALILVSPEGGRARINGLIAPPVALLSEGDQLDVGDGFTLHVLLYRTPQVGRPTVEVVGKKCPVCLTPIGDDQVIYRCAACGTAMHLDGDDGLDCGRLASECRTCQRPVVLEAGYAYVPKGLYIETA
jgi:hypothetical protein